MKPLCPLTFSQATNGFNKRCTTECAWFYELESHQDGGMCSMLFAAQTVELIRVDAWETKDLYSLESGGISKGD